MTAVQAAGLMRKEQEIFDELAKLCTSPGYVHAIAYFCYRDCLVPYADEMTAENMVHLFSAEHLVRTEISTLIGLLIKVEIDYVLPAQSVIEQYVTRTEELLEEIHRAMSGDMFAGRDIREVIESGTDPFDQGPALREPIFYSGESAYGFQYRDLSPRKYAADNEWLESRKGFSIQVARDVVDAITRLQGKKLVTVLHALHDLAPDERTILPGFTFTLDEVSSRAGIDKAIVERVVAAFTIPDGDRNQKFRAIHDFNAANATPILPAGNEGFILFQQYSIAEALYDSPFYWMISDAVYRDAAMLHRGRFTEEFSRERLELVFGKQNVHSNVDIYERKGRKVGEIDVLVLFGDRAIILQAKSKRLTLEARKGNDNQIKEDFKKSVQESYDQGYSCAPLLGNPKLKLARTGGQPIQVPRQLKAVYILCVVSDNYPALSFQTQQFLKSGKTDVIRSPFVMDVFTLDVMTEMLDSPLYFLSYVDKRTAYSDKLMSSHELVLLSFHLKKNLWFDDEYSFVWLQDDISADLDVAMSVRRDNVPGRRTPDGIMTRVVGTAVGSILKEIESRADAATIELGLTLLSLGENAVTGISKAMEMIAAKARLDGRDHDVTFPLNEAGAGLTIHCNNDPIRTAGPRLQGHCTLRKYAGKATRWYGICIRPVDGRLMFGVTLNYEWKQDSQMDDAALRLSNPRKLADVIGAKRKKKIGRNDQCPCGSGLKSKKCCHK
jgi:hypothetical protein